nr:hypothetical protein Iba_chr15bCG3910 [Ipomoea batatas]
MERSWFQRPRLLKACSRSSASESCEAIETSEFDEMLSICSREAILAILALGDIEDALKQMQINMLRPRTASSSANAARLETQKLGILDSVPDVHFMFRPG